MAIDTQDIETKEPDTYTMTNGTIRQFGLTMLQVEKFEVLEPTTIKRKRDSKEMILFKVRATYKFPLLSEEGDHLLNERGYPDYLWINIDQANFCGDGPEREEQFNDLYNRLIPYSGRSPLTISFKETSPTKREGNNGRVYYGVEVKSAIDIHTDSLESVQAAYAEYCKGLDEDTAARTGQTVEDIEEVPAF